MCNFMFGACYVCATRNSIAIDTIVVNEENAQLCNEVIETRL